MTISVCNEVGTFWTLESPDTLRIWDFPSDVNLAVTDQFCVSLWDPVLNNSYRDICRFIGTLRRLQPLDQKCAGYHVHEHRNNSAMVEGRSVKRSVLRGRYPLELRRGLADLVKSADAQAHAARLGRLGLPTR